MPFVLDRNTTYESGAVGRDEQVWVSTPGSGLEKRQCTLQVCFSAEDNLIKIEIIFRGTGQRISKIEKESYHAGVDVYFQKNAWADLEFSLEWVKKTLKNETQNSEEEFVLFCDNLSCQTKEEFQKEVRKINGIVWYGLAGNCHITSLIMKKLL